MIALLQKAQTLSRVLLERLKDGKPPLITGSLPAVVEFMRGRRFGSPLARFRPAIPGLPVGGESGKDIERTFQEMRGDLELLFQEQIHASSRVLDVYEIFSTRRDRLALKLAQLRLQAQTLLAQQEAGSRASITDSFNTLDLVDLDRSTVQIDLDEGVATLPPDTTSSVRYDGSRVVLEKSILPAGAQELGPSFGAIFSPYRLDAWYLNLPVGQTFEAHVNITGVDYEKGATEEVSVNALRLEPTGPAHVEIDWSPDGFNWHDLSPKVAATIRDRTTFHFQPVNLGFLRFRVRHSEEIITSAAGQIRPVGIKRVEILRQGYTSKAQLFSVAHAFSEPIHTVLVETDVSVPFGTRIDSFVSQQFDGPWLPITQGQPVAFDTIQWQEIRVGSMTEEDDTNPATFWQLQIPISAQPLPNTGELIAGRNQVQISAFPFDWRQLGERQRVLDQSDWVDPHGEVRSGTFTPVGGLGSDDITPTSFTDAKNPIGFDDRPGERFLTLAILQGDGSFALQAGYNYRLRAYVWCATPTTLQNQMMGVVNLTANGGAAGTIIAPFSVWINGRKNFQQTASATSVDALSGSQYLATLPLQQGYNQIEILLQLPKDLTQGQSGLATSDVYLYFQPDLFAPNLESDLGIRYIQAYQDAWKRVSEFDLRYNIPPGKREAWAFKFDPTTNETTHLLLNHDPTNSVNRSSDPHPSYQTVDGVLAGYPVDLLLRYPAERNTGIDNRVIFFRVDFARDEGATQPCSMASYRAIAN